MGELIKTKRPLIPPKETKEYLAKNEIPQLFECLMTGLMYHRPVDYLQYLQECIENIKNQGIRGVRWDLFLETREKTLPSLQAQKAVERLSKYQPQPGIDSLRLKMRPQTSVICVIAGPGIEKFNLAEQILMHYPSFIHLSMGDLCKNCAKLEDFKGIRWKNALSLISAGDLAPEDMVLELLIWNLNQHPTVNGFVVDGFPRTFQQYEELKCHVGMDRLAAVVLIDISEEKCLQQLMGNNADIEKNDQVKVDAIKRRICNFKNLTLPMCKCIDDDGKLRLIDGDMKPEIIQREIQTICEFALSGKVTGPSTRPDPGSLQDAPINKTFELIAGCPNNPRAFDIPRIMLDYVDNGRQQNIPKCPTLVLLGGPGSGRTTQALALCEIIQGIKCFNVTDLLRSKVLDTLSETVQKDWDVVARRVHSSEPPLDYDRHIPEYWDIQIDVLRDEFCRAAQGAKAVIIEGYMNDETQLSNFNKIIGGADIVILLDCDESTMYERLSERKSRLNRFGDEDCIVRQRVNFFKQITLPVVRFYDEMGKLIILPADRNNELITSDLVTLVEYYLAKEKKQDNNSSIIDSISDGRNSWLSIQHAKDEVSDYDYRLV